MNMSVAITTAPRPGPWLLGRCLLSLKAAGFTDRIVFAEPESVIPQ
jgi:hypothetical protein